ncbi:hypothetical protein ACWGJB_44990 [Streptomyces sp. NPDC054813]
MHALTCADCSTGPGSEFRALPDGLFERPAGHPLAPRDVNLDGPHVWAVDASGYVTDPDHALNALGEALADLGEAHDLSNPKYATMSSLRSAVREFSKYAAAFRIMTLEYWRIMLSISFDPHSVREPKPKQLDSLAAASEMDLRYEYFETDVILTVKEFGTEEFPGTPLLDFAFSLLSAARKVQNGGTGRVIFTESGVIIQFQPSDRVATAIRSWDEVPGKCGIGELISCVVKFCDDALGYIVRIYPEFQDNPSCGKLVGVITELKGVAERRE